MQEYLDSLSYHDLDMVEIALSEETTVALRLENTDTLEDFAAARLDQIIQKAPPLKTAITLYRAYEAAPALHDGGDIEETAFFAGSSVKPTDSNMVVLEVNVPVDGKALQIDAHTYILPRGLKLNVTPSPSAPVPPGTMASISLVDLDAEADEFYNQNHGKDGRFGAGKSGSGGGSGEKLPAKAPPPIHTPIADAKNKGPWPKIPGTYAVKKIAEAPEGKTLGLFEKRVKVDGFKVKSAYEVTGQGGRKIKVYDLDGKEFGDYHKHVSSAVADMDGLYPLKPTRSVVMLDRKAMGGAFAWIYPHRPEIFVNQRELRNLNEGKFGDLEKSGWFMPSLNQKSRQTASQYFAMHEYGHHYDFNGPTVNRARKSSNINNRSYHEANALWKNRDISSHMSTYGKSLQVEGYAETFAEWHNSKGKTKNPAAIAYAKNEGWYGSGTKSIRASAFSDPDLTIFEPFTFAAEEVEVSGEDLRDLLPFDPDEGPIIIEFFDKPPRFVGDGSHYVVPTPEQAADAEALIRGIMDTLGSVPTDLATGTIQLAGDRIMVPRVAGDPETGDQETGGQETGDQGIGHPETGDPETGDPESGDQETGDPVMVPRIKLAGALADEVTEAARYYPEMLLSLIDLNSEHVDEFFNKNHGKDGRFGAGSNGSLGARALEAGENDGAHGLGGSTIGGVRGFDPKGKPIPGTDAWIEAHGMSRDIFEGRPYTRFEQSKNDPAIAKEYGDYPKDLRLFNKVAGQTSGYIMERHPAPESPYGHILGEVRPDKRVVLDPSRHAMRQTALIREQERLAEVKKFTGNDLIKDRQTRLKGAEDNLKKVRESTPDSIRKEAADRSAKADTALKKAKVSGDPEKLKEAQIESDRAKRGEVKANRTAANWRPDKEVHDAETAVASASKRLERVKGNPESALATEIRSAELRVARKQNQFDKTAIKYTFPSQPGAASRLDVHQDAQNLKNLTQGKGRVYWAMEGCIKQDAVLTAIKKEDPSAAIIGNPSVTLWQNGETQWVAKKYLKGREVVLLPDADGVKNPDVVRQAKGLQAALKNSGVGEVFIASPPLLNGKIEHIKLRSGVEDERKGVDDHLGAGRGTLGQMTFSKQTVPHISLAEYTRGGGATGTKINKNSLAGTEATLTAISSIAGQKGVAKIPKNMLSQASGLPPTSARDARNRLERIGLIKVEHVFDQDALGRGKRIQVMSDERIHQLVRQGVIKQPRTDEPFTSIDFDESPIISILHDKHKAKDDPPGALSSIPTWKPPKSFKGWTSPVTGKPANTYKPKPIKKASAGKMIIRTKAGAKRYGVSVGQSVPTLRADGLLSTAMIVLDGSEQPRIPELEEPVIPEPQASEGPVIPEPQAPEEPVIPEPQAPEEPVIPEPQASEEFYNSNHGKDGRFGGGKSSGGGGSHGSSAPSDKGAEHALLDKAHDATKTRSLTGGRSGASVELLSGPRGKVIRKSGLPSESVDKEYLAAKVGRALGAPVPRVARANAHTIVSDYLPGHVAGTFRRDIGRVLPLDSKNRKATVGLKGARELALLDIAISNQDRHGGNFLVRPGGKSVVGIDHTTTFGGSGKAFLRVAPSKALENHWKDSFTKDDYKGALSKIKSVEGDFKKLGRQDWYDDMATRLSDEAG